MQSIKIHIFSFITVDPYEIRKTQTYIPGSFSGHINKGIHFRVPFPETDKNSYLALHVFFYYGSCPEVCTSSDSIQIGSGCSAYGPQRVHIYHWKNIPLFPFLIPTNIFNGSVSTLCPAAHGNLYNDVYITRGNADKYESCAKRDCNLGSQYIVFKWTGADNYGCLDSAAKLTHDHFAVGEICYFLPKVIPRNMSWTSASEHCVSFGASLAVFHSVVVLEQIKTKIANHLHLKSLPIYLGLCKKVRNLQLNFSSRSPKLI